MTSEKEIPRTIFIWDVHGCFDELLELLTEKIQPTEDDRIIFLGDIINKWPKSAEVVKFIFENKYEVVSGNHEQSYRKHVDEYSYYKAFREFLSKEEHEWLIGLPIFIEEEHFIAVHAGLAPGKAIHTTERKILTKIRTWDGIGEDTQSLHNPPWYTFYNEKKPVFYGHWWAKRLNIQKNTFGLDGGCVYGGSLCAYALETGELFQVPAKQVYCPIQ